MKDRLFFAFEACNSSPNRYTGCMGLFGAIFGVGKTVHHSKDWLGRKKTTVTYHDTGKKKTYSHGNGFFGNHTKTKVEKNGRVVEKGHIKQNLFWGAEGRSNRTDGTQIDRSYRPGFFKTHVTTHVDGICHGCKGSGRFRLEAKPCFVCHGSGRIQEYSCNRCKGTGQHKPAVDEPCRRCGGSGRYTATYRK